MKDSLKGHLVAMFGMACGLILLLAQAWILLLLVGLIRNAWLAL